MMIIPVTIILAGPDRRNDSMGFFTDSPYEYMMTQKPDAGRRESTPSLFPPGHRCYGCPYGKDRPCLGVCIKELGSSLRGSTGKVKSDKNQREER